ncbi:MAG: rhodanese-like domain-containing protein [Acidimicrobiales bacterium]
MIQPFVDPATLAGWLGDVALGRGELALLDAREQGTFSEGHLFRAVSVPLSRLELLLERLVPRRDTRMVWCDDDGGDLAATAAARAAHLGWTNGAVLAGGIAGWVAAGHQVYSGVNVPSKAFGELVEESYGTPRVSAGDLAARQAAGHDLVILDSRPMGEFRRRSIPGGIDCPGAELVRRVREAAPDPATTVVVNCAGRTRSIIGSQSLIDAGLPNPVYALENGTMGWELAGLTVATGVETEAPEPGPDARAWAREAAAAVGVRYGVTAVPWSRVEGWRAGTDRTTLVFDVRTGAEYQDGHPVGARHAPGGQLVQATDEYVGTLGARLVLVDDDGVRATMTAAWLRRLGWADCFVLEPGALASVDPLVSGPEPRPDLARTSVPTIKPADLYRRLEPGGSGAVVVDVDDSEKFRRRGHIPDAWWGIRSRLDQARARIGPARTVVLTSSDGTLARLAVADARAQWPDAEVMALAGGNKGWRHSGLEMEPGFDRATTSPDDRWYKPYEHAGAVADAMQGYLDWEVALVAQVAADPLVTFPDWSQGLAPPAGA